MFVGTARIIYNYHRDYNFKYKLEYDEERRKVTEYDIVWPEGDNGHLGGNIWEVFYAVMWVTCNDKVRRAKVVLKLFNFCEEIISKDSSL
jgi:hypothetical protein